MSTTKSSAFAPGDWGLLGAAALIWGSSFLFMRIAVVDMRPGLVAFLRLLLGVLTLAAFPAARRAVPWSAWPRIAAVGLTWMALPFFLFSVALQWIDSSLAGILNATVPLFTALIGATLARRMPGWRQQAGLVLGFLGVLVVSMPSASNAQATLPGSVLVLAASLSYGIALNLAAPLQKAHGPLPVIWRAEIAAMVLIAPLGLSALPGSTVSVPSALAVLAVGALGTGLAFAAFITLVGRVGSTRASVTAYFFPPVAIAMGALVRHEAIAMSAILGTALIGVGAFLVSRADTTPVATSAVAKATAVLVLLLGATPALPFAPLGAQNAIGPTPRRLSKETVWALPRLTTRIVVDGSSSDVGWRSVQPIPLTVYLPVYASPAVERTEARVAYDSDALYVMIDAWELHTGGVRASSMIRDDDAPGDFVNVLVDAFGDRQNAVNFSTTPGGGRNDWTVINDAQAWSSLSPGWNGVWEVAVAREERGWHAEYRIPFSTLRFTPVNGRVEFGFGINRLVSHIGERVVFPATEPSSALSLWKPSNLQRVSVEGISPARSVRLTPYVIAGREGLRAPDPVAGPWSRSDRSDVGGDLKMALAPYLTLDVTANTDFAEAEADDQRVNLTRYPLLFPERRQFFVEQAGTFEVKTGDVDLLFNSRRVGLTSAGETVRLLGGVRVSGRVRSWDVGFFDAQMDRVAGVDRANLGVLRVRRSLGDARTWVGVMATSRLAPDSNQVALGVDGELHVRGDDYFSFAATTLAGEPGAGVDDGVLPRGSLRLQLERRRNRGAWYRASVATTGARYEPALGYVERGDAIRPVGEVGYGRVVSSDGHVLRGNLTGTMIQRNAANEFDAGAGWVNVDLELPTGALWRGYVMRQEDDLLAPFTPTPGTSVPVGRHGYTSTGLSFTPATGPSVAVGASVRAGEYFDGRLTSASLTPEWRASAHLRLSADLQVSRLAFDARTQSEWSRLARLRVLAAVSPKLTMTALVQGSSLEKLGRANLRLRYNAAEGHDLWVVYHHAGNLDRDRVTPTAPLTARAGLLVKYTRSFGR